MKPVISIQHLSKKYRYINSQRYLTLRDRLTDSLKNIFNGGRQKDEWFQALDDINLDIESGDRIGIIGHNGAGKTTLLKIISRISPPTSGTIAINGRIASLLEVGTGFHPELTGRENIYFNGSILGLKKKEIDKQFEEIIDFSGVEKFINTPLKFYSSGMELRLAFSVAAHLQPEILLIDEVLAVGDIEFQKKCLGKMEEISKSNGRTILFVSHDLGAISTLTNKCVFLQAGQMVSFDITTRVINQYVSFQKRDTTYCQNILNNQPTVVKVVLITSEGESIHAHGQPLSIEFDIYMPVPNVLNMNLSIQIFNHLNKPVLYNWLFDYEKPFCRRKGITKVRITYPKLRLYKGTYFVRVHLAETKTKTKFQQFDCCYFDVEMLKLQEPDWGWQDDVCQYLDDGIWLTNIE